MALSFPEELRIQRIEQRLLELEQRLKPTEQQLKNLVDVISQPPKRKGKK